MRGHASAENHGPSLLNFLNEKSKSPVVPVRLSNGVVITALIDTGATNSSVSPKVVYGDLKGETVKLLPLKTRITVADGGELGANEIAQIVVTVAENYPVEHNFCVVKFAGHDMIVGYDFMLAHNVIIDVEKRIFQMNRDSIDTDSTAENQDQIEDKEVENESDEDGENEFETEFTRMLRITWEIDQSPQNIVKAENDLTIPVNSEMFISGALAGSWTKMKGPFIVQGSSHLAEKQSVQFSRAVVTPEPVIPLRVMNLSHENQILHKGTVLAQYEEGDVWSDDDLPGQEIAGKPDQSEAHFENMISRSMNGLSTYEEKLASTFLETHKKTNFTLHSNDLGHTTIFPHKIDTGDSLPIHQGPRRLPIAKRQVADKEIKRMLDMGVIEPSMSPWSSPIVLAAKKGGDVRFCIDFRKVNAVTKKDSFPLPRIDDSLHRLEGSSWFSTMDLASGYWQVAMDEDDAEKTAFIVENGLYQFKVLPFGLCNAGATFQRIMQLALSGLSWEMVLVYIDDLIVHSKNFEEHLSHLREVFDKLSTAGLKMSPKKCDFFRREVVFLGHIVSAEGVRTDPAKIEAVTAWPQPTKLKEVQAFLGLCGYYRKFIKGFSSIAKPLYRLTQKDQKFVWNEECEQAFEALKNALTSTPVLAYPRSDGMFILDSDASNFCVGSVLSQVQDGEEKVILYFSKSLSKPERNYCVTRRELLAIILGVQHCHHYLLGRRFKIRTDHGSLRWLLNFRNPEGQTARWLSILSKYDFDIEYRPGSKHGNSDGLSRRPCSVDCKKCSRAEEINESHCVRAIHLDPGSAESDDGAWVESVSAEELKIAQQEDASLKEVSRWFEDGTRPSWAEMKDASKDIKALWHAWEKLRLRNGLMFHHSEEVEGDELQAVAPKSIRHRVFYLLHNIRLGGHQGIARTTALVKKRFWWPLMRDDVQRWIQECVVCQERKKGIHRPHPLQQELAQYPMERVGMDILSFTSETDRGNVCALVACDYFTKYVWAVALKDHKAATVADALVHHIFLPFSLPTYIHSDQGKEFQSELLNLLGKLLQISKTRTCPYRPQSDGLVERMNRTCLDMVSKMCDGNPETWDEHLPFVMAAYNATPHASSGCSPNLLMFNRETTMPIDLIFDVPKPLRHPVCPNAYVEWVRERVEENFQFVRRELGKAANRQKKSYDKHACPRKLEPGKYVWRWYPPLQSQDKLNPRNIGPYKVLGHEGHGVYEILRKRGDKPIRVHIDHLKPHFGEVDPADWPDESDDNMSAIEETAGFEESAESDTAEEMDVPQESVETELLGSECSDTELLGRSKRKRKVPTQYRDFELY